MNPSANGSPHFVPPNPRSGRPLLLAVSAVTLCLWTIFLLLIALRLV